MSELENDMRSIASFVPLLQMKCLTLGPLKLKSRYSLNGMTGDETKNLDIAAITAKKYSRVEPI
jgi:hypothetical protein